MQVKGSPSHPKLMVIGTCITDESEKEKARWRSGTVATLATTLDSTDVLADIKQVMVENMACGSSLPNLCSCGMSVVSDYIYQAECA